MLIRDSREIWVGDGDSTVKVFDVAGCSETTTPKATIATGVRADNRADEMCYDPVDQLILVANNAASPPFATLISTIFYAKVQKILIPAIHQWHRAVPVEPADGLVLYHRSRDRKAG